MCVCCTGDTTALTSTEAAVLSQVIKVFKSRPLEGGGDEKQMSF